MGLGGQRAPVPEYDRFGFHGLSSRRAGQARTGTTVLRELDSDIFANEIAPSNATGTQHSIKLVSDCAVRSSSRCIRGAAGLRGIHGALSRYSSYRAAGFPAKHLLTCWCT